MTEKEVEAFLKKSRFYDVEIDLTKKQIESLKRMGFVDTTKHVEELNARIKKIETERILLSRSISKIQDVVARMIYNCRYILLLRWEQVGCATKMTSRNAKYIHDKSFPNFVNIFEGVMKDEGVEADYIVANIPVGEKED